MSFDLREHWKNKAERLMEEEIALAELRAHLRKWFADSIGDIISDRDHGKSNDQEFVAATKTLFSNLQDVEHWLENELEEKHI